MSSVYDREAFAARVNYAIHCIKTGHTGGRAFDTCFEMFDGSYVARAILLRAERDPELKSEIDRRFKEWYTMDLELAGMTYQELREAAKAHRAGKYQQYSPLT